jgi:hypothetical protein
MSRLRPGAVRSLVLQDPLSHAMATASFRFRIRHLGAGDRGTPGRTQVSSQVFLPDHWHAIFYPRHPLTISRVMEAIKDGATKRINRSRRETGTLGSQEKPQRNAKGAYLCATRSAHCGGVQLKGRVYSLESREGRVGKPGGGVALVERARSHGQRSTLRRHAERAGGGSRVVARR